MLAKLTVNREEKRADTEWFPQCMAKIMKADHAFAEKAISEIKRQMDQEQASWVERAAVEREQWG